MNTVDDIGKEEAALRLKMPVDGFAENRDEFLTNSGLYDEWRKIYKQYVDLAETGDIEALKRAIFYAWYQLAEPGWLSGISDLPDEQTKSVVFVLEDHLSQGLKDAELEIMLPYYMLICSYYLERYYPLPFIQKASVNVKGGGRPILKSSEWAYRGQMGDYWGV